MNDRKKTLFLGNGLNMLNADHCISWKKLMDMLNESPTSSDVPYTLLFEKILHDGGVKFPDVLKTKKEMIQSEIKRLGFVHNPLLKKFVQLDNYSDILTTNYDYNIENEIDKNFLENKKSLRMTPYEDLLSMRRGYVMEDKRIWHIHGEIETTKVCHSPHYNSESIMIGFNHYALYLQTMMNTLKNYIKPQRPLSVNSKFIQNLKDGIREKDLNVYWMFQFFTRDIDIVGFSLDFCETHLWWLLSKRAELISETGCQENTIRFFEKASGGGSQDTPLGRHKIELLKSLKVDVVTIDACTYADFYNKVYNVIK